MLWKIDMFVNEKININRFVLQELGKFVEGV